MVTKKIKFFKVTLNLAIHNRVRVHNEVLGELPQIKNRAKKKTQKRKKKKIWKKKSFFKTRRRSSKVFAGAVFHDTHSKDLRQKQLPNSSFF